MSAVEIRGVTYEDGDPWPSLVVSAEVIDGPRAGERMERALALAPKQAATLKRFLITALGVDDIEALEVDEDTNLMTPPGRRGHHHASRGPDVPWPFA